MRFFIDYLSGNVPGGFLVLSFLLFTINVALYYLFKSSKLFDKSVYRKKVIRYNGLVLFLYIFLWFNLRPPELPDTVVFLPFTDDEKTNILYPEILQEHLEGRLTEGYRLYRWEWVYMSANPDSFELPNYRGNLIKKLGLNLIFSGTVLEQSPQNQVIECTLWKNGSIVRKEKVEAASVIAATRQMIHIIDFASGILERNRMTVVEGDDSYWQKWARAKWALVQNRYENLPDIIEPVDRRTKTLLSEYFLQRGIALIEKNKNSNLTAEDKNPNFQKILSWLVPYSREAEDNVAMNLILGRLYLRKQNYGMAELCLKRAVTQDRFNPRIYYYMSFLHPSRIKELGFKDRITLLEHTTRLDPGYVDAVYELANELYTTGSGGASAHSTERALRILNNFLHINANQPRILGLLGQIYLQAKYTLKAYEIYKKLLYLDPDSAENHYNLGVVDYQLKNYDEAEKNFLRAIKIDNHLESYLYLGAIYRNRAEYEKALYYFRERIKRKTGDDDHYAKEAMRQVRIILDILSDSLSQDSLDEIQTPGN